jgi:hypothetical protein
VIVVIASSRLMIGFALMRGNKRRERRERNGMGYIVPGYEMVLEWVLYMLYSYIVNCDGWACIIMSMIIGPRGSIID